jgi:hypothetical protein
MIGFRFFSALMCTGMLCLVSANGLAQTNPAPASSAVSGSQNAAPAGVQQNASSTASTAPVTAVPTASSASSLPSLNAHTQRILVDTDKLVDLVQQLKTELQKSNQDVLSLSTIHQAEDIEKLAKELEKQLEHAKK